MKKDMIEKIIKQINPRYRTKKELIHNIKLLEVLRDSNDEFIKKSIKINREKDEEIQNLKSDLKVLEDAENQYITEICKLESNLNGKSNYIEELEKRLKEAKENNQSKNYTINNLRKELELEQYERGRVSDELVKTEKKLNRERNKNSKLNIELLQVKNINKELINKVNISAIARHQLKELCKYNENNNKEPDRVKRPGVLVHKQVSGVKVYELANLM
ncbi:hypothetical protein UMC2_35661 [[Clostridium] sordellii]|uniref:hypothetical protein n=1 Tax=Paraclostridium sordellii TaxID=1505 RepID=UPI000542C634|nr:hypothetical protein [Paeniclostridium sordellii]CEK34355.1 hypothetical protein UMC2_35661 [[Clostridium] sordellii] [Paeniclostridium sordellii]